MSNEHFLSQAFEVLSQRNELETLVDVNRLSAECKRLWWTNNDKQTHTSECLYLVTDKEGLYQSETAFQFNEDGTREEKPRAYGGGRALVNEANWDVIRVRTVGKDIVIEMVFEEPDVEPLTFYTFEGGAVATCAYVRCKGYDCYTENRTYIVTRERMQSILDAIAAYKKARQTPAAAVV